MYIIINGSRNKYKNIIAVCTLSMSTVITVKKLNRDEKMPVMIYIPKYSVLYKAICIHTHKQS